MAESKNDPPTTAPSGDAYVTDPKVRIGHVHLKVADLERALRFYAGCWGWK